MICREADVNIYRQSFRMGAREQGLHDPDDVSHPDEETHLGAVEEEPSRKRRRNQVDYKQLYEQMKKEGGI